MTRRTAAHRSAVLGLGAVGVLVLAAPASALDVGATVQDVAETTPLAGVVDPLTAPLAGTEATVGEAVTAVDGAAPAPVGDALDAATGSGPTGGNPAPTGPPPSGPGQSTPPASEGGSGAPQQAPQQSDPAAAAASAASGGTGVAAMPSSFAGSTTGLEGFSGRGGGFGSAANPMSLFGAPQVATVPQLAADLPTPLAVTPAGGVLADIVPVDVAEDLPAALVALACTVVGGAVAAHVAALRARREPATA